MASGEKGKSDTHVNCMGHKWPKVGGGSMKSSGTVRHEQCNCCLAYRLTFTTTLKVGNEWKTLTEEHIVEPSWALDD
jgi:hypothetical protein